MANQHNKPSANQTLPLEEIDANSRSLDDLKLLLVEESNRPIDLTKGPVLRLQLYRRADDDYILGFILHHIAADFWALDILVDELSLLYAVEKTDMAVARSGQAPAPGLQRTQIFRMPTMYAGSNPCCKARRANSIGSTGRTSWRVTYPC